MATARLPQSVLFVAAGGVAACVNVATRRLLSGFVSFELAVVLAYALGMLVAYALMRRFVFGASGDPVANEIARFAVVNLLGVMQTIAVSLLLARALDGPLPRAWAEGCAHVVGVGVPVVTSFLGHRMFSFRKRAPAPSADDLVPGAPPDL